MKQKKRNNNNNRQKLMFSVELLYSVSIAHETNISNFFEKRDFDENQRHYQTVYKSRKIV